MRLYLTRDFLSTGKIEEAEGHRLTGRDSMFQINGKRMWSRIYHDKECHETMEDAVHAARRVLEAERKRISEAEARLAQDKERLERREEGWRPSGDTLPIGEGGLSREYDVTPPTKGVDHE